MILYLSEKLVILYIPLPMPHSEYCTEGNKLFVTRTMDGIVFIKPLMFLLPITIAIPMSHCVCSILSQLFFSMSVILATFYRLFEWIKNDFQIIQLMTFLVQSHPQLGDASSDSKNNIFWSLQGQEPHVIRLLFVIASKSYVIMLQWQVKCHTFQ